MSYLNLLQQQIAQRDQDARRFGEAISSGFGAYFQEQERQRLLKQQEDERQRQLSQQQAQFIQQVAGPSLLEQRQFEQAAKLVPQYREAIKTGFGIELPNIPIVGAPVTRQIQGPPVSPQLQKQMRLPPRLSLQQPVSVDTGMRTFEAPETQRGIRAGLMMRRPEPMVIGKSIYDPETKQYSMLPEAEQSLELQRQELAFRQRQADIENQIAQARLSIARAEAAGGGGTGGRRRGGGAGRERPPRLVQQVTPEGTFLVEARPGIKIAEPKQPKKEAPKISKEQINLSAYARFEQDLANDQTMDQMTKNSLSTRALKFAQGKSPVVPKEFKRYIAEETRNALLSTQGQTPAGTGALGSLIKMMEQEKGGR